MPEAVAVVGVFFVCCLIYVIAKVQARNPALHHPAVKGEQLKQQREWLEERLRRAERENWSREMRQPIVEELEMTVRKLAQLESAAGNRGER